MGKVVDMLYFPLIDTVWPTWIPVIGGNHFQFFRPVFNLADAAISIGVFSIIIFRNQLFKQTSSEKESLNLESEAIKNSESINQ